MTVRDGDLVEDLTTLLLLEWRLRPLAEGGEPDVENITQILDYMVM